MRWLSSFGRTLAPLPLLWVCASGAQAQQIRPAKPVEPNKPTPAPMTGPTTYVVKEGDTMWTVARDYYKNPYEWPRLWSQNPEITNPHWIYPGLVVRLRPEEGDDGLGIIDSNSDFGRGIQGRTRALSRFQGWQSGNVILREQAYLDPDALRQSGLIVGSSEDHFLLSPSDELYVKFEQPPEELRGKELTIYRHIPPEENEPRASKVPPPKYAGTAEDGEIVRVMGAAKVLSYDPNTRIARVVIVEGLEPIERGFLVADIPRRFVKVPPRTATLNLDATVVTTIEPVGLYGDNQIVFINAGADEGVQPGHRFRVIRQGDAWRQNLMSREDQSGSQRPNATPPSSDDYPFEVVGEILALHTRPHSTTGVVILSRVEIEPGDQAQLTDGY